MAESAVVVAVVATVAGEAGEVDEAGEGVVGGRTPGAGVLEGTAEL
ncbi:MAG: hypothetical protein IPK13_19100 [Deltaproteobacteria bacterium]|nr:hypothetical protein [Deltaproteobacteria bacterium]